MGILVILNVENGTEQQILRSSRNSDKNSVFYFLIKLGQLSHSIVNSKGCFPLKSFSIVIFSYVNLSVKAFMYIYIYTGIDLHTYSTVLSGK